jgi:hypothetical protein
MLTSLVTDAQQIGPTGLIMIAGVCFLVGIWFSIAVFSERVRAAVRWGEEGWGSAMSALGAGTAALNAYLFGALLLAHAFQWTAVAQFIFYLVIAAITATAAVSLRDYARTRNRI